MDVNELQSQNIGDLTKFAQDLEIEEYAGLSKQELILNILEAQNKKEGIMQARGVLEVLKEGYGFLRSPDFNYLPGPDDIYVSPSQIKRFGLRTGHQVYGEIRPPKQKERFFALLKLESVNDHVSNRNMSSWRFIKGRTYYFSIYTTFHICYFLWSFIDQQDE